MFSADVRYDYYGIGDGSGPAIPLKQPMDMLMVEALRESRPNLYLGMKYAYVDTEASVDADIDCNLTPLPNLCEAIKAQFPFRFSLATLAPIVEYDTRNNQFSPQTGWFIKGTAAFGSKALGSDSNYQRYSVEPNHYRKLSDNGVLATRLASQYATSDSPFFLYPAFGAGSDLRGYQTGTFRDQFLLAGQGEYRYRFNERWRGVAFAGLGTVDDKLFGWGKTLPSLGIGARYILAPKNNVELLLDYAWGRDDSQFYLGIGEAF